MAKRKGSPVSRESASSKREREGMDESEGMVDHDAREVENAKRLDKLPQEVWEKITDNLENDDLFPLALSCRYFRQKQKELVARTRQSGSESGKPRRALKTNLKRKLEEGKPASAEYLSFCGKVRVSHPRDGFFRQGRIKSLAAFHGHLPLLKKLSKYESHTPAEDAARGGQLETLQWLKTRKGFKMNADLFRATAEGGKLESMKWLRSEGCPGDGEAWYYAAASGHLEILKWLKSEGRPWDARTCAAAAEGGQLEVLKWLRSKGCPWDEVACASAALSGHLDVLKYLRANGCPWDRRTRGAAVETCRLNVLKYAQENGCPGGDPTAEAEYMAFNRQFIATMTGAADNDSEDDL